MQDATKLSPTQEHNLAELSQWYTSAVQDLQQRAQDLCQQLKEALVPITTQSHMSMQVFDVAAALQDCLEEQHECGLQVVRQVCLQVGMVICKFAFR